jgi:acetyl-CoA acetyltransferase
MVLETVEGTLDDAGVHWDDIDAVVTASVDLFDGLTASSIAVTEVVGAVMNPETRIAADGLSAAIHAVHQIRAGAYGTVLVVAHGKASMAPYWDLTEWAMDPVYLQALGVDFLTVAGVQANLIAGSDTTVVSGWAEQAAERRNAAAGGAELVTADAILASPVVADPIQAEMCAPLGDGACAVILSDSRPNGAVVITGTGHDLDSHYPGERDLRSWSGLARAARRAYRDAAISEPSSAFVVAEPSCMFPHEEALFVEATSVGPDTVLSPEGGLFGGTAPVVSGLSRLLAAARAIEGHPGHKALAHGAWGPAGQGHAVAVLEAT